MNSETGEIKLNEQIVKFSQEVQAKYIPIDEQLMTLKQKEEMQVSPFDNRSVLGKIRIQHRNTIRNKPCPCGSGVKFKKCCWSKTI